MSDYEDQRATEVGERRRSTRRDSELQISIDIDSRTIGGQAENISAAGVFFFSHEPLHVTVRMQQDGRTQSYPGRLVRVERLSQETTGFAIEFERQ